MAKSMTSRVPDDVTLSTSVLRLTRAPYDSWKTITLLKRVSGSVATVYLDLAGTADAAALPSTGPVPLQVNQFPASYEIAGYGPIGLAGDAAGVVTVVLT